MKLSTQIHTGAILSLSALAMLTSCHSKKGDGKEGDAEMTVNVATPQTDSIVLSKTYPAFLLADRDAAVVARVTGYITAKHYEDGALVKEGAPLFTIESTTYRSQLAEAQSRLESAKANHDYCERQYEAMKKALESDAVSKMDVIQAESNLRQSEADITSAQAAVNTAGMMLGYCTVRAPFTGRISSADVVVGDFVAGEGAPVKLATIYDDLTILAIFSVEDSRYIAVANAMKQKILDYKHVPVQFGDSIIGTYTGELDYASPDVQKGTGTVKLRLLVDNPDGTLKSGMYANVDLPYAVRPDAMLIKEAAIGTDQLGKYVYVVNDSDKVVYTPVETGDLYHDTLRIVNSGLKPTDRYVTQALLKVRDGMTVKTRQTN